MGNILPFRVYRGLFYPKDRVVISLPNGHSCFVNIGVILSTDWDDPNPKHLAASWRFRKRPPVRNGQSWRWDEKKIQVVTVIGVFCEKYLSAMRFWIKS